MNEIPLKTTEVAFVNSMHFDKDRREFSSESEWISLLMMVMHAKHKVTSPVAITHSFCSKVDSLPIIQNIGKVYVVNHYNFSFSDFQGLSPKKQGIKLISHISNEHSKLIDLIGNNDRNSALDTAKVYD